MGKRKGGNFFQVSRKAFSEKSEAPINNLSLSACKLYFWLHELEHRYTSIEGTDWFFFSNENLSRVAKLNLKTVKKAKKELIENSLIEIRQMHWQDPQTGKKSHKHITAFRIL